MISAKQSRDLFLLDQLRKHLGIDNIRLIAAFRAGYVDGEAWRLLLELMGDAKP